MYLFFKKLYFDNSHDAAGNPERATYGNAVQTDIIRNSYYRVTRQFREVQETASVQVKPGARDLATGGPCSISTPGIRPGSHLQVLTAGGVQGKGKRRRRVKGGRPVASIVCCECCDESSGSPEVKTKCNIVNKRQEFF